MRYIIIIIIIIIIFFFFIILIIISQLQIFSMNSNLKLARQLHLNADHFLCPLAASGCTIFTYGKVLGQTSDKIHCSNPCVFPVYACNAAFKSIILLSSLCKRYWLIPWLSVQRKLTRKEVCLLFLADWWHLLTNPIHFYRQCTLIHLSENAVRSKLTHGTTLAWGSSPWRDIRQRILISVCNWQDWAKNVTEVAMVFASYRQHLLTDSHINQGEWS